MDNEYGILLSQVQVMNLPNVDQLDHSLNSRLNEMKVYLMHSGPKRHRMWEVASKTVFIFSKELSVADWKHLIADWEHQRALR